MQADLILVISRNRATDAPVYPNFRLYAYLSFSTNDGSIHSQNRILMGGPRFILLPLHTSVVYKILDGLSYFPKDGRKAERRLILESWQIKGLEAKKRICPQLMTILTCSCLASIRLEVI